MFGDENITPMGEEEFLSIRDFIYDHSGLFFEQEKKYLLQKRLSKRLSMHQVQSFRDYLLFLKYDRNNAEELSAVLDLLTTNETYFFREKYQLDAFRDEIIPEILSRKTTKTLRVWSAGCSSGEEPYTIAIMLSELMKKGGVPSLNGWNIEILGSDISHRVLKAARKGEYGAYSFRDFDPMYYSYFDAEPGGKRKVKDEIRNMVTFTHLNLLDADKVALLAPMDVIFCRNVIIYFDAKAKKSVVTAFHDKLDDGGYLLLGHSESLMNISTRFELKHLKNDMVYRKPVKQGDAAHQADERAQSGIFGSRG